MATVRGFVYRLEVGRAGLVTVSLIHDDATTGNYIIRDLDADPERFNERLSKLALLRDAMDRAEPVEIEHSPADGGNEIQRAVRITRDQLASPGNIQQLAGLVVDVFIHAESRTGAAMEKEDLALISLIGTDLTPHLLSLDLQIPERLVAQQQLEMIREAQGSGRIVRAHVTPAAGGAQRIIAVGVDNSADGFGGERVKEIDGFVESLSLIKLPYFGAGGMASSLAHVRFTLAPPFTGAGNTVGLKLFNPITVDLLTPKGSLAYLLFEAGLRDNLRMRVSAAVLDVGRDTGNAEPGTAGTVNTDTTHRAAVDNALMMALARRSAAPSSAAMTEQPKNDKRRIGIALACELLAPLASASRPVWISIARTSLDHGPDGFKCTSGLPTSDLHPRSLRDLRIPYPAVWTGIGCFNAGVYRFQICLPVPFKLFVDGEELCLHDAENGVSMEDLKEMGGIATKEREPAAEESGSHERRKITCKLAHACLCGEHEVRLEIEDWSCEYQFIMDVFRIR